MKILFCVELYYPSIGGAQEVVRQLAEHMVNRGHDVTVATSKIATRTTDESKGVKIRGFEVCGNRVQGIQGEIEHYQRFLAEQTVDIILFYAAQQWAFDAAWPVLPSISARKILIPCGYSGFYNPAYQKYFQEIREILPTMDAVIYHAQSYRDIDFARSLGLQNSFVIPNGADIKEFTVPFDPDFRRSLEADKSTLILLTVGTVTGLKGHLEVVQAFAKADFEGRKALLILNGNQPEQNSKRLPVLLRFISIIRGYGLLYAARHLVKMISIAVNFNVCNKMTSIEDWVNRINQDTTNNKLAIQVNLPRSKLIQAYLQSDLFVFASNIEYSPLVLFEACAAGLPFLCVNVGNSSEIVDWTQGGELCKAPIDKRGYTRADPAMLARRIEKMVQNPVKLRQLGQSGKQAVQRRFNWDSLTGEYESLFYKVLEQANL